MSACLKYRLCQTKPAYQGLVCVTDCHPIFNLFITITSNRVKLLLGVEIQSVTTEK